MGAIWPYIATLQLHIKPITHAQGKASKIFYLHPSFQAKTVLGLPCSCYGAIGGLQNPGNVNF
jgi:hypothetical protein